MPRSTNMRKKSFRMVLSTVAVLSAVGLAGCTLSKVEDAGGSTTQTSQEKGSKPTISVKDGASDVSVNKPITITADSKLSNVTVTNESGGEVKGESSDSGKKWTTSEELGYGRTYTVSATANGQKVSSTFTTVSPTTVATSALQPLDQSKVGIGQVIGLRFDSIVPDKKAVQDAIKITTTPHVDGAFYWINGQEVRWRPENFWKPGTKVKVEADLYGKNLGDGMYGDEDRTASFTIGDAVIATADDSTRTMTVERNGKVEKTMPISMGSPDHPTPNGTYFLGDHNPSMIMDSSTYGLAVGAPGGYRSTVNYATQMSYSGIYVHSAPWSIAQQGVTDVSHGCINVSPANAEWFMNNTLRGDIVIVKNTSGGEINGDDGLTDWNIPWSTWKKGNADT